MDDISKQIQHQDAKSNSNLRYRVRLKNQLIEAYGAECDECQIMGGLYPVRQVPLPKGTNTYTGYAAARRLGFPEGLYKLYCELHHPHRTNPFENDPALAEWLKTQKD